MNKDLRMKTAFTLAEGATHVGISHNIGGTFHRFVESFTHVGIFHITRRVAFTLAEVLITLGIIGIVSAMTIPTLINNYKEKVRDNQFKKVYATLTQSLNMTLAEYDYIPNCYYPSGAASSNKISECPTFWQKFASKLNVAKYCQNNSFAQGCIPHYDGIEIVLKENHKNDADYDEEYWENYSNNLKGFRTDYMKTKAQTYVLSDGSIIIIYVVYTPNPIFLVDVNGFSAPNKWSHDLHLFAFEYDGSNQRFRVVARGMETYQGGITTNSLFKKLFGTSF